MLSRGLSRLRSQRKPQRPISGLDLPEVAVAQGLEARPAERLSHVPPQPTHTHRRYASGIEAVNVEDAKRATATVEPDDASTRGFLPSPSKPHNVPRSPFWRNKRARRWLFGAAFIAAILLTVMITVAVTQSLSHKQSPASSPPAIITTSPVTTAPATSTSASATSTTSGCASYTGPAMSILPSAIIRQGGPAPTPTDSNRVVTLLFSQAMSYDEANSDTPETQNAFTAIPQGFAYALGGDASQFVVNSFTPIDTTPQQCYIATQAKVNLPEALVAPLQNQATADRSDESIKLWHNPNGNTASLFSKIKEINT